MPCEGCPASADPWHQYAVLNGGEWPVRDEDDACYLARAAHVSAAMLDPRPSKEFPFRATRQLFGATAIDLDGERHRKARELVTWFTARQMPNWTAGAVRLSWTICWIR